ncbi:hypothetical protein QBC33DRAFT_561984 [Phialemonium atrogriseum]|uniref:Uncharacterized protein n=1 Tax=Phialemonium atrogriseum TaxID=1093897 RepID=A0AAJ0BWB2_9PEZI|nr:uncharacterized protein QBC33DRAFT_561984 [Phialemonium atrogriseum]KAK1764242.1 hypothetical protein QBC33DRAFT_561984 [Phialemonium atrogriseum]
MVLPTMGPLIIAPQRTRVITTMVPLTKIHRTMGFQLSWTARSRKRYRETTTTVLRTMVTIMMVTITMVPLTKVRRIMGFLISRSAISRRR